MLNCIKIEQSELSRLDNCSSSLTFWPGADQLLGTLHTKWTALLVFRIETDSNSAFATSLCWPLLQTCFLNLLATKLLFSTAPHLIAGSYGGLIKHLSSFPLMPAGTVITQENNGHCQCWLHDHQLHR